MTEKEQVKEQLRSVLAERSSSEQEIDAAVLRALEREEVVRLLDFLSKPPRVRGLRDSEEGWDNFCHVCVFGALERNPTPRSAYKARRGLEQGISMTLQRRSAQVLQRTGEAGVAELRNAVAGEEATGTAWQCALEALGEVGDAEAARSVIAGLRRRLLAGYPVDAGAAVQVIAKLDPQHGWERIAELLSDQDPKVRWQTVRALEQVKAACLSPALRLRIGRIFRRPEKDRKLRDYMRRVLASLT